MVRHFLTIEDLNASELHAVLDRAAALKTARRAGKNDPTLRGKSLAMIFEKPSTRTRVSFEVAMYELGGHALHLTSQASQLGRGETYADTARVLSRFVHGITIRTFEQVRAEELAAAATVPVINALSDLSHPCQILADLLTIQETRGHLNDLKVAYVGDGNNVANSWIEAAIVLQFQLAIATPPGFEPAASLRSRVQQQGLRHVQIGHDAIAAVRDAHAINTDTWVSMGQEGAGEIAKKQAFTPFQVNAALLRHAAPDAIALHCLPAHRGEEITDDVMDGPQSRILDQAENRLHAQKALLEMLLR
ncbi:MAG: ornithine carbamoyltransferase [Deltaproteobacteria bacterium]|nr:ornithine carbamoyltransferase [Deltaproteobacteria bacterium]